MLCSITRHFYEVEDQYRDGYDEALASLQAVHTRQDVDSVGTEHSQHPHIHVVQHTWNRYILDLNNTGKPL